MYWSARSNLLIVSPLPFARPVMSNVMPLRQVM
jgi:hypothetical protein